MRERINNLAIGTVAFALALSLPSAQPVRADLKDEARILREGQNMEEDLFVHYKGLESRVSMMRTLWDGIPKGARNEAALQEFDTVARLLHKGLQQADAFRKSSGSGQKYVPSMVEELKKTNAEIASALQELGKKLNADTPRQMAMASLNRRLGQPFPHATWNGEVPSWAKTYNCSYKFETDRVKSSSGTQLSSGESFHTLTDGENLYLEVRLADITESVLYERGAFYITSGPFNIFLPRSYTKAEAEKTFQEFEIYRKAANPSVQSQAGSNNQEAQQQKKIARLAQEIPQLTQQREQLQTPIVKLETRLANVKTWQDMVQSKPAQENPTVTPAPKETPTTPSLTPTRPPRRAFNAAATAQLRTAIRKQDTVMFNRALAAGGDLAWKDKYGETGYGVLWYYGVNLEMVKAIARHVPGWDTDVAGKTFLIHFCLRGDIDGVRALLDLGADVNARWNNDTALMCLLSAKLKDTKRTSDIVRLLIERGADVSIPGSFDNTPLMGAIEMSRPDMELVQLLIRSGADVNAKNDSGSTSLIIASNWNHLEVVKLLIKNGADVNARTDTGGTGLKLAEKESVKNILRQAGARE